MKGIDIAFPFTPQQAIMDIDKAHFTMGYSFYSGEYFQRFRIRIDYSGNVLEVLDAEGRSS